jgi:hypothetical protein
MFGAINLSRRHFLGTAAMTIAAAECGTITGAKTRSGVGRELLSLASATAWLHSPPLTADPTTAAHR